MMMICYDTQSSRSTHPVVYTPPLTIILALALILIKLFNNMMVRYEDDEVLDYLLYPLQDDKAYY